MPTLYEICLFIEFGSSWREQIKKLYDRLFQIFTEKNVAKEKSYTVKHFCQNGIPKAQVYHVIEYVEDTKSVNHGKVVGTRQNLTKPQEDIIKKKSRKQKLPLLQLQGSMIYSSELMYTNEFFCLFILVCMLN